jgi:tetratricopeptide (TPR) repeat protein
MRGRRSSLMVARLAVGLAVTLSAAPAVRADGPSAAPQVAGTTQSDAEPAGYRETVDEAVREFSAQHYEEARALFARAHALFPNARTHRGLGLAEFELRNYGASIRQFEAALRAEVKPLTSELRTDTERMLARAHNFVARVRVDAKPATVDVLLDGAPVQAAQEPLLLPVGEHSLEVQAPGFLPQKRQLSVKGGEENVVTFVLVPKERAPTEKSAEARPWYRNPWLWTGVGVVVAGAAAGAGYALTREDSPSPYGGSADAVLHGP